MFAGTELNTVESFLKHLVIIINDIALRQNDFF